MIFMIHDEYDILIVQLREATFILQALNSFLQDMSLL